MTQKPNKQVRLRPRAQHDLDEIRRLFPKTAEQIVKKITLLYEFPEIGSKMDQAFEGYRQLLSGKYRIIYQIVSDTEIEIAYIRHCARQLGLRIVSKDDEKEDV